MLEDKIHALMTTIARYVSYVGQVSEFAVHYSDSIVQEASRGTESNSALVGFSQEFRQYRKALKKIQNNPLKNRKDVTDLCNTYINRVLHPDRFKELMITISQNDLDKFLILVSTSLDYSYVHSNHEGVLVDYFCSLMSVMTNYDEHGMGHWLNERVQGCGIDIEVCTKDLNSLLRKRYGMMAKTKGLVFSLASIYRPYLFSKDSNSDAKIVDTQRKTAVLKKTLESTISHVYSPSKFIQIFRRGKKIFNRSDESDAQKEAFIADSFNAYRSFYMDGAKLNDDVFLTVDSINRRQKKIPELVDGLLANLSKLLIANVGMGSEDINSSGLSQLGDDCYNNIDNDYKGVESQIKSIHMSMLHPDVDKKVNNPKAINEFYQRCTPRQSLNFFHNLNIYTASKNMCSKYKQRAFILGAIALFVCLLVFGLSFSSIVANFYKATPGLFYVVSVCVATLFASTGFYYISTCVYNRRVVKTLSLLVNIISAPDSSANVKQRSRLNPVNSSGEAISLNILTQSYQRYVDDLKSLELSIDESIKKHDNLFFSTTNNHFNKVKAFYEDKHANPDKILEIGEKFIDECFSCKADGGSRSNLFSDLVNQANDEEEVIQLTDLLANTLTFWHINVVQGSVMNHFKNIIDYENSSTLKSSGNNVISSAAEVFDAIKVLEMQRVQYAVELKEALKTYGLMYFKLFQKSNASTIAVSKIELQGINSRYESMLEKLKECKPFDKIELGKKVKEALKVFLSGSKTLYQPIISTLLMVKETMNSMIKSNLENLPLKLMTEVSSIGDSFYDLFSQLHYSYLNKYFDSDHVASFWRKSTDYEKSWIRKQNNEFRNLSALCEKYKMKLANSSIGFVVCFVIVLSLTVAPEHTKILNTIPGLYKLLCGLTGGFAVSIVGLLMIIAVGMYHRRSVGGDISSKLFEFKDIKPVEAEGLQGNEVKLDTFDDTEVSNAKEDPVKEVLPTLPVKVGGRYD